MILFKVLRSVLNVKNNVMEEKYRKKIYSAHLNIKWADLFIKMSNRKTKIKYEMKISFDLII